MNNYLIILPVVSVLFCALLGFFALSRNVRHPVNIGFVCGMLALAVIASGCAVMLLSESRQWLEGSGIRLFFVGESLLPAAWLPFSLFFAKSDYQRLLKRWFPLLVVITVVSILCAIATVFFMPTTFSASGLHVAGSVKQYSHILILLGLMLNLALLENTFRSSRGTQRWQIKYVIIGVGAVLAFFLYLSSQIILFSVIDTQMIHVISAIILISAAIISLFIVRHRLLDMDVYISRYVVYNSITVVVVGIYLLSIGLIAQGLRYFNVPFNYFLATLFVFLSLIALLIVLNLAAVRIRFQHFINRHFYAQKYEFRDKWMETIEKINSKSDVAGTYTTLIEMIEGTMGVRNTYCWRKDSVSQGYSLFDNKRLESPACCQKIDHSHSLIRHMRENPVPFWVNDFLKESRCDDIKQFVEESGVILCTPLVSGDEVLGFILQGETITGEQYVDDDFELLRAIATQAAVQIKQIRLAHDLTVVKEMEVFSEMSSFIMHDLKNLTNSLSLVSQNARHNIDNPEFQRDAIRTIDSTVSRMKGLIERLSSVPKRLELKKKRIELDTVINRAMQRAVLLPDSSISITKEMKGIPGICIDSDAMEMVFINLLTNAYSAIGKAGTINIQAIADAGNIIVSVSDSGCGMTREFMEHSLFHPFKTTKKHGFGIGLYQCKTIVEAHGGRIDVESAFGEGATFTLTLPVI